MSEFLAALGPLALELNVSVPVAMAVFTRFSLFVFMMPGIGGSSVPIRTRLLLVVMLTYLLLPLVPLNEEPGIERWLPLLTGEALIGFALGLSVRILLLALNITGAIVAQALSLSQIFGVTQEGDSSSLLATMLTMAATTMFLTAGLGQEAIAMILRSFDLFPLGAAATLNLGQLSETVTRGAADALAFGIMLALPFMVLNFAYYLLMGFMNRAMPQLMVTFVGLPAITLSGFMLLMLLISTMLTIWLLRVAEVLNP